MFCFPSMKNMQRSIPCLIRIDAADMSMELYGSDTQSELNILKKLEESMWMARWFGIGWRVDAQWIAASMAMASLRKMLKEKLSGMTGSPKNAHECFGAQKLSLSLLVSDQTSRSASLVDHSSAPNSHTLSKWLTKSANQRRSSHMCLFK